MKEKSPHKTSTTHINPMELHIGNLIQYNGLIWYVYGIHSPAPMKDKRFSDKYVIDLFDGAGIVSVTIEDVEGVSLTEEILIKAGFEKEVILWDNELDYYFVLSDNDIIEDIYITIFKEEFWFASEYDSNVVKTIPVKGIHSLQNRWYSLTEKELK